MINQDFIDELVASLKATYDPTERTFEMMGKTIAVSFLAQDLRDKLTFETSFKTKDKKVHTHYRPAYGGGLIELFTDVAVEKVDDVELSEHIIKAVHSLIFPPTEAERAAKREQYGQIIERHKKVLGEFEELKDGTVSALVSFISKNRGYGNGHWGNTAASVMAYLSPAVAELDEKTLSHLQQLLNGEGLFGDENRKVGTRNGPLFWRTLNRAQGIHSSSLGNLIRDISEHSQIQGKSGKITYILDIIQFINDFQKGIKVNSPKENRERDEEKAARPPSVDELEELKAMLGA